MNRGVLVQDIDSRMGESRMYSFQDKYVLMIYKIIKVFCDTTKEMENSKV